MFKNTLIHLVIFGLLATAAYAAVSIGDFSSPDHPGKCVINDDVIVDPGTHQYPGQCGRIICSESGFAETQSCGVQLAGPGCELGDPLQPDADYPDCCELEVICE